MTTPGRRPRAVLVAGAPGTGKSTVGAAVAARTGATLLDLDTATLPLVAVVSELVGDRDLDSPLLAALTRAPRYATLEALARENLSRGLDVVLVAPFTREVTDLDHWSRLEGGLADAGAEVRLVLLHLDEAERRRRLARRGAGRDRAKADHGVAPVVAPGVPHLSLDVAGLRPAAAAAAVVDRLGERGSRAAAQRSDVVPDG